MTLPDRAEIVERERRWMRPAGIASIVGALLSLAGIFISGTAIEGDSRSESLLDAAGGDVEGQLLLGAAVSGLGLILVAILLTFVYKAALDRSERVRKGFLYLAGLGAVFLAAAGIITSTAYIDAADEFAAAEQERTAESPASEAEADEQEEEANDRAFDAIREAPGAALGSGLGAGGTLAFVIAFFNTGLWGMRTGLFTRFWGSLGMASSFLYVFATFFGGQPLLIIVQVWFMAMGLMLAGLWVGARPPAWGAGRAIPWPRPGEPPEEDADPSLVEGEGREITPGSGATDAPDLDGAQGDAMEPPDPPGEPPRKRKRRR